MLVPMLKQVAFFKNNLVAFLHNTAMNNLREVLNGVGQGIKKINMHFTKLPQAFSTSMRNCSFFAFFFWYFVYFIKLIVLEHFIFLKKIKI